MPEDACGSHRSLHQTSQPLHGMPSSSWSQPCPLRYTQTLLAGYNFSQESMKAPLSSCSFPQEFPRLCRCFPFPPTCPRLHSSPLRCGDQGHGPQGHPGWDWPCHPLLTSGHVRRWACCRCSLPSLPETHPFRGDLCFLL